MSHLRTPSFAFALTLFACACASTVDAAESSAAPGSQQASPQEPNTVHVRAFDLPPSNLLSPESRAVLERMGKESEELGKVCKWSGMSREKVLALRACNEKYYYPSLLARYHARYAVTIEPRKIAGVPAQIIAPAEGVLAAHADKVLINLHGGAYLGGGHWGGQLESIPIASVGKFKIVTIDYRMAPEYKFPAASEDVEAVYREFLKTYRPENIGIYGCSAGGELTGQVVAWLQWKGLPMPGAVGMFCAAGGFWGEGDSGHYAAALLGFKAEEFIDSRKNPYLEDVEPSDPIAFPIRSAALLAKFPPSLLIASTRDVGLSSAAKMQSSLIVNGVEAELHVWEGLDHAFFYDPDLPESREAYDVIAQFFDKHLGQPAKAAAEEKGPTLEDVLEEQVNDFVKADKVAAPAPCQVLFVGSSSFVKWQTLKDDMAPLPVINRGFGGSHIEYVNRWFDRVVAPYHPRAIVFYAGENDIAAGKSVERIVAEFDEFMKRKTAALGNTPVYFISVKPSKLRWWQFNLQSEVNKAIKARAAHRKDLHYIDIVPEMLHNGEPKDLFVGDNLHMNAQGYAIWAQALKAAILRQTQAEERSCKRRH